jgi:hypothetical protein
MFSGVSGWPFPQADGISQRRGVLRGPVLSAERQTVSVLVASMHAVNLDLRVRSRNRFRLTAVAPEATITDDYCQVSATSPEPRSETISTGPEISVSKVRLQQHPRSGASAYPGAVYRHTAVRSHSRQWVKA